MVIHDPHIRPRERLLVRFGRYNKTLTNFGSLLAYIGSNETWRQEAALGVYPRRE